MSPAILLTPLITWCDMIECVFTLGHSGDDVLTQRDGPLALGNNTSLKYKCPFNMSIHIKFA
jgi:hypothetical protein